MTQTRAQAHGKGRVGVGIGAADPVLQPAFAFRDVDHPQTGGAVVDAPAAGDAREAVVLEPFVGVHKGCDEQCGLAQEIKLARDVVTEEVTQPVRCLLVVAHTLAGLGVREALVDVAGVAGIVLVPLHHEGRRHAGLSRDLPRG